MLNFMEMFPLANSFQSLFYKEGVDFRNSQVCEQVPVMNMIFYMAFV